MKQCTNCHAWVQPNDTACRYCGAAFRSFNHPIAQAKKFWESTTFFVAIIIFTAYAAGEVGVFIYDLFFNNPIETIRNTYQFLKEFGLNITELSWFMRSEFDYVMPIWNTVRGLFLVFPLLTTAGLWVFYSSCKAKPESAPVKSLSGTFLKIEPIAKFFISVIALIGILVVSAMVLLETFSTNNFTLFMIISLLFAVALLIVVGVLYDIGMWRTISAVQEKLSIGKTKKTVSFYVIVINIAQFVWSVLSAPADLLTGGGSALVSLLRASAMFMFALVLISYRSKVQNPPKQPVPAPMPVYPTGTPYYNLPQPQSPYGMPQYLAPAQQPVQPMYRQPYVQQPPMPQYSTPPVQNPCVTPPPAAVSPNPQETPENNGQAQQL